MCSKLTELLTVLDMDHNVTVEVGSSNVDSITLRDQEDSKNLYFKLLTKKPIEQFLGSDYCEVIRKFDECSDEERDEYVGDHGLFLYYSDHMTPESLDEIYNELVKKDKVPEIKENESLMEFALRHGCDYMDMSTGHIYRA